MNSEQVYTHGTYIQAVIEYTRRLGGGGGWRFWILLQNIPDPGVSDVLVITSIHGQYHILLLGNTLFYIYNYILYAWVHQAVAIWFVS